MSIESYTDPRTAIVREKYFSLRPKPLEKWLWAARAPGSAERVFWYHWDIGHQNGSWVSQVPIRIVAKECGVDVGTVTRAYQWLKARGLVRRVDAGRDDGNPFRQATSLTEVFVPRELIRRLAAEPNRRRDNGGAPSRVRGLQAAATVGASVDPITPLTPISSAPALSRHQSQAILQKLSDAERRRLYAGQRDRKIDLTFDADTRLSEFERHHVLETLRLVAGARPAASMPPRDAVAKPPTRRRLSALQLVETRQRLRKAKGEGDARGIDQLLREIAWSVEEGSLGKFETRHALAIACKKVRDGVWSTPYGMPADWTPRRAHSEACGVAGGI